MAEGIFFVCTFCPEEVGAWDEGNPYYIDEFRLKRYAYHPDDRGLPPRIGNDEPHLCLSCGAKFAVDSREPRTDCPDCHSTDISPTFQLEGKRCPRCKEGVFVRDPKRYMIS